MGLRGSAVQHTSSVWKKIWRVKVPYRIQLFTWKALHGAIPVRDILHHRIHIPSMICPICHMEPETILHALVTCDKVENVWRISDLNVRTESFKDKTFLDWVNYWMDGNNEDLLASVMTLMWSIWCSRNNLLFNGRTDNERSIIHHAHSMYPNIGPRRMILGSNLNRYGSPHTSWNPPPQGWIKANTDGAWDSSSLHGGLGLVLRNHNNIFLFAAAIFCYASSAEETEVRAIWTAMRKARELKVKKLLIESDAAFLVDQLNRKEFCGVWNTDAYFKDIQDWWIEFEDVKFVYIPRTCNLVAHDTAAWAKNSCYMICSGQHRLSGCYQPYRKTVLICRFLSLLI
ncbi:Reverse transcriptase zinc-binding domain [Macleaya cordata]|uniref:Reverse transcriptase zinc-binding domain n=1 Tax=Macleaya cordata TaxID=56857 RepID=A0A200Q5U1_MACCD|nr:Reverse transcriptase zinc-binding domain [Macleaya cordata]